MSAWLVRAGRHGEREDLALDQGLAVVGWSAMPSLEEVADRGALARLIRATYPDAGDGRVSNWAGQLWAFRDRMTAGDLVVLPLKGAPILAIGQITGPYEYRSSLPADARHVRAVSWLRTDISRSALGRDLRYSLGAFLTVCEVKRNQAAARFAALVANGFDPAVSGVAVPSGGAPGGGE